MKQILEFQGENTWASNFWSVTICYKGLLFPCVENAYQAAKCDNEEDMRLFLYLTPGEAKRKGRTVNIRKDWEEVKVEVMHELLRLKFQNPQMKKLLIATGDIFLQEGNMWHDIFWGVDLRTGKGANILGKLLMKVRDEVRGYDKEHS